jgi:DNA-binding CsgD family transcriptional regulator/PAS domain-containing protein
MLNHGLDLAELHHLAPAQDLIAPGPSADLPPLDRFVEGVCRMTGALAGCIVADAGQDASCGATGVIGRSGAAKSALLALGAGRRGVSPRGYGWIRDACAPDHGGLTIATPGGHMLLVFAHDQLEDEATVARILALAPGLAAAAGAMQAMAAELEAARRRDRALTAVLRQSDCGIVVVDADTCVQFANPVAQALLDAGDGIEVRRNMLRPTRYHDAVRFQAALDAVITPARRQMQRCAHGAMLLLDRPGPERPLIAVIAPADVEAGDAGDAENRHGAAAAIVRLLRPEACAAHGLEPICHLHGLSPVETQLVACLSRGLTLGEAATAMRIKPDTARTYLKQVFAKTDVHRQADLLQLFLRYQRAVSGDIRFEAA